MMFAPFFAVLSSLAAFVVDGAALVEAYDIATFPSWLGVSQAHGVSNVLKVTALAFACRQLGALERVSTMSMILVAALAASLVFDGSIIAVVILWILVAGAWLRVSAELQRATRDSLYGYRQPLRAATLLIGLAMLAYFFDVPRLVGHLLFDLCLAGLGAATISTAWTLTDRRRVVLYTAALVIPGFVYIAPVFPFMGALFDANREQIATLGAERVDVEPASSLPELLDNSLSDYELQQRTPIFRDVWLFGDGRALAIERGHLFERAAAATSWKSVRELDLEADFIHFDRRGERGVLGGYYGESLTTTDGGRTWTRLDPYDVFSELRGREFGDRMLDDSSAVFLDPESERGSFMMGCRFFTSTDFGQTWVMDELVDVGGKTRCPADSPFSVDQEAGIARAAVMGSEFVLRRAADEPWSVHCLIDYEAVVAVNDAPACDDEGVLTTAERAFVDLGSRERTIITRQLDDPSVVEALASGENVALDDAVVRDNGRQSWLSGPGYLALSQGSEFSIDTFVPPLETILPFDGSRALGIAQSEIYTTEDGGRVWRRSEADRDTYLRLLIRVASTGEAYFASDDSLWLAGIERFQQVKALPEGFEPRFAGSSTDGEELFIANGGTVLYSRDHGESWSAGVLPSAPEWIDEDGEPWPSELSSMDCVLGGDAGCVAVFDSGVAYRFRLDAPEDVTKLPDVHMEEGYADGPIVLLGDTHAPSYFPAETSQLHRLATEGEEWDETRLGIVIERGAIVAATSDRKRMAIQQEPGELLIVDESGSTLLFDEESWQEEADYPGHSRVCWDASNDLVLFTNSDARFAVSRNGGGSWQEARAGGGIGTACGTTEKWLWLIADGVRVYERS